MAPKKPIRNKYAKSVNSQKKRTAYTRQNRGPGFLTKLISFLRNNQFHFVLGMLIGGLVIYLFLSFLSYFFTGAADKSIFDNIGFKESLAYRDTAKNWTSVMGAYISETLIDNWFGVSSFALIFFMTIISLRLMNVKFIAVWKAMFHSFFWLIWGSFTFGFFTEWFSVLRPSFFHLGGLFGDYAVTQSNSFIGRIGTLLIILFSLVAYFVVTWSGTIPFLKNIFRKNERRENKTNQEFETGEDEYKENQKVKEEFDDSWLVVAKDEALETETTDNLKENEAAAMQPTANKADVGKEGIGFEINRTEEETIDVNKSAKNPDHLLQELGKYDPTLDLSKYEYPTLDLMKQYDTDKNFQVNMQEQNANKDKIITTLRNFGIEIESIKATVGPTITLYEIVPQSGIRISKIRNLESDIMLSLAATGIRIIAPIPGKGTIGIEVPNNDPQIVSMHSVISSKKFQESKFELPIAFGKTITNEVFTVDLTKMPHLLVAGATGQGKSVGLNAIIASLLYKKHPSVLKFVMIDPKKVEFNIYSAIEKHFLAKLPDGEDPIITDTSKVVQTLNSLTMEMDQRYDLLKKAHARNIKEYNEKFVNRQLNPENGHRFLPYIVVIVDEFGDLIMTAGKEVEMPIARIAQLARAVGIHMIIATQRPSVNIITGVIKANFPARVAFRVSSMIDSRTILDAPGANQLVGRGDMLFSQGSDLIRVQCAFIDTPEVERISNFIATQRGYSTAFYLPEYVGADGEKTLAGDVDITKRDPLFDEAARLIVSSQQGSTSSIQRKFSIGYNRAGRIVDQLEVAGIIGPNEGSKARQVLVQTEYELEQILNQL